MIYYDVITSVELL